MGLDLNFNNLKNALPQGAITASGNDVLISVKSLIGEESIDLSTAKVSELIAKLLNGCAQAQTVFNNGNQVDINSYPQPVPGIPQMDSEGQYYTSFVYSVAIRVPLDINEASAMPV